MRDNSATAAKGISEVWWPLYERLLAPERATSTEAIDIARLTSTMARGGEDALREFYERYFDRLLGYLLVLTRGREDAAREALRCCGC